MSPIKAILFDCDNTLILSDTIAFEAESELVNEILEKHGKKERYSGTQLLQSFVGQNFHGLLIALQKKHGFTLSDGEFQSYLDRELIKVAEKLNEKAQACEGVAEQVENVYGTYVLGVVSSSALSRVVASVKKVGLNEYLPNEVIFSAISSLPYPSSKPDPAIYHYACEKLGVLESQCVAIEDSRNGATAAKRAKIPLIGYVWPYYDEGEEKVMEMERILRDECGAIAVMHHWREFPHCLKLVEIS